MCIRDSTQAEHDEAMADDVYARIQERSSSSSTATPYSYFIDELISQIKQDLMEQKGYTSVQASNAIYSGGLRIYTTQDPQIQQIMDEEFQNEANFPENIQIGLDWALTVDLSLIHIFLLSKRRFLSAAVSRSNCRLPVPARLFFCHIFSCEFLPGSIDRLLVHPQYNASG